MQGTDRERLLPLLSAAFVMAAVAGTARGQAPSPAPAAGADGAVRPPGERAAPGSEGPAEPEPGAIGTSASVDWTTGYLFRGILQEDEGVIVQPAASIAATLHEGEGALSRVTLTAGIWSSLHSGPTGAGGRAGDASPNFGDPEAWYELDAYAGLAVGLGGRVQLGLTGTAYTSPNGMFPTVWELSASAALDDSAWFASVLGGRFGGLQPSLTFAAELSGTAFGTDEGRYGQVAIAPSLELASTRALRLTTTIPVTLGLGLGDYYEDDAGREQPLGYLDAGLVLGLELAFVPARFGSWRLTGGAHLLALGDHLAARHHGDAIALTAGAGLAMTD